MLYYTIVYYALLYSTILYYAILYYPILSFGPPAPKGAPQRGPRAGPWPGTAAVRSSLAAWPRLRAGALGASIIEYSIV